MKSPLALCCCSLLATLTVGAVPGTATLDLVSEPGFNEIELSFQPPLLPAGEDTTTLTGSVELLFEIDADTGQVSEMTVLDANVMGSPVSISGSTPFVGSYSMTSTTLGATLDTPIPPGIVDPPTGEFDAAEHTFTVNSGTLSGNIMVPLAGINENISFDFATEPVGGPGSGTGTVTLTPAGSTPTSKTYDVIVLMPLDVMQSFEVEAPTGPIEIPVSATGTAKMVGQVTIEVTPEDPYVAWTEVNSIPGAAFEGDENVDGVPNGLQWALGLAANGPPFPHLLQPVGDMGGTVDFTVTFPAGGSAADISVVVTDDPESVPFSLLASGAVSAGNPIPSGTTGTVTISLPKAAQGFVQLSVQAPAP